MFVDVNGNLFIADSHNHRIRVINTVGVINTFAGNGTAGYSGDGGQCTAAELYTPSSLVFDGLGNLYFSDNGNYRLRKINNTSAVGIIQFMISNETKIYPNPNKGFFIVETNTTTKQTLQVFDVNSKLVLTQIIQPTPNTSKEGNSTTIDACNLVEGVYNLSIISNEGVVNKRLVIVR